MTSAVVFARRAASDGANTAVHTATIRLQIELSSLAFVRGQEGEGERWQVGFVFMVPVAVA
jgi:hypothetical protein